MKRLKYNDIDVKITQDDFINLTIETVNRYNEKVFVSHEMPIKTYNGWIAKAGLPEAIEDLIRSTLKEVSDFSG